MSDTPSDTTENDTPADTVEIDTPADTVEIDTPADNVENEAPGDHVENDDTATEESSDAEDFPLGPSAPGAESEMESSIEEEDTVYVRRPRNGSIYSEQLKKRLTLAMQHKRGLCTPKFRENL